VRASVLTGRLGNCTFGGCVADVAAGQADASEEAGRGSADDRQAGEERGDEDGGPEDPLEVEHRRHLLRTARPIS
jgi:hypothetical protein